MCFNNAHETKNQYIYLFLSQDDSGGGVVYNNKLYGVIPSIGSDCVESVELINVCGYKRMRNENKERKKKEKLLNLISRPKHV